MADILTPLAAKTLANRLPACFWCSTKHQRLVLGAAHQTDPGCVGYGAATDIFNKAAFALLLPLQTRLGMMQKQLVTPAAPKAKGPRVACRLVQCKKHFASNINANRHMLQAHAGSDVELYPVEPKKKSVKPKKKSVKPKQKCVEPKQKVSGKKSKGLASGEEGEEWFEGEWYEEEEGEEEEFEEEEFEEFEEDRGGCGA